MTVIKLILMVRLYCLECRKKKICVYAKQQNMTGVVDVGADRTRGWETLHVLG